MSEQIPNFMRLAFRSEGHFVNCYIANLENMKDAHLFASAHRRVMEADPALFEEFKELCKKMCTVLLRESIGATPTDYTEGPGPEHERGGHG